MGYYLRNLRKKRMSETNNTYTNNDSTPYPTYNTHNGPMFTPIHPRASLPHFTPTAPMEDDENNEGNCCGKRGVGTNRGAKPVVGDHVVKLRRVESTDVSHSSAIQSDNELEQLLESSFHCLGLRKPRKAGFRGLSSSSERNSKDDIRSNDGDCEENLLGKRLRLQKGEMDFTSLDEPAMAQEKTPRDDDDRDKDKDLDRDPKDTPP